MWKTGHFNGEYKPMGKRLFPWSEGLGSRQSGTLWGGQQSPVGIAGLIVRRYVLFNLSFYWLGIYPEEITRQICLVVVDINSLQTWVHVFLSQLNRMSGQGALGDLTAVPHVYLDSFWECLCGQGFALVPRRHTSLPFTVLLQFYKRETCFLLIQILMWYMALGKNLRRQEGKRHAGI